MAERDSGIDLVKFISSILVIAIHTRPFQKISSDLDFYIVDVICRMAVPFFCVCSGYYLGKRLQFENGRMLLNDVNKDVFKRYGLSILKIYVIWSIAYLMVQIPEWIKIGWFSVHAFVDWGIAFFLKGSYYHLWYLICVVYALPVCYYLMKYISCKKLFVIGSILYLVEVMEYAYRGCLPEKIQNVFKVFDILSCIPISLTRILPFFILGICFANRGGQKQKCSIIGLTIALLLLAFEARQLYNSDIKNVSYIFMTYIVAIFFFKLVINLNKYINMRNSKMLANVSTGIYCVHPMIILLIRWKFNEITNFVLFIIVVIISIIFVYGTGFLKEKYNVPTIGNKSNYK